MKRKNCVVCDNELTGYKKRFCCDTCYQQFKRDSAKRRYEACKIKYPEVECSVCKIKFFPMRLNVTACSRSCSRIQGANRQKAKKAKWKKFKPERPFKMKQLDVVKQDHSKFERVETAQFNSSDVTKDAVMEYLGKGNTILKFPDSPRPKIPSVNIVNGHSIEAVMGFGLEFEFDPNNYHYFNYGMGSNLKILK